MGGGGGDETNLTGVQSSPASHPPPAAVRAGWRAEGCKGGAGMGRRGRGGDKTRSASTLKPGWAAGRARLDGAAGTSGYAVGELNNDNNH